MANSVFHNWAHNVTGPRGGGTREGNVFFDQGSRTIYSYGRHFPMARFVTMEDGRTVVALTRDTYSSTTAKHRAEAYRAIPAGVPVFLVYNVNDRDEQDWHKAIDAYLEDAKDAFVKVKRARTNGPYLISAGKKALAKAKELNDLFSLGHTIPEGISDEIVAEIIKDQAEASRIAKERAATRDAFDKQEAQGAFQAWLSDVPGSYFPSAYGNGVATSYLRTHGDEVQTSRHASVPLAHAIRAYLFVKLCKERGKGYETNGHTVRLGHYTLDRITPKGDTYIGCHFFSYEVLEAWATKQGIAQANATDEALTRTLEVAS